MWAYNETFYQIYPIGFCGAPVHNDGVPAHRILKLRKRKQPGSKNTRTPDPLRVMHDDFLIFKAMIR